MVTLRWQATQALHLQTRARYVGAYHTAADDDERQASHTLVGVSASYRPAAWQGCVSMPPWTTSSTRIMTALSTPTRGVFCAPGRRTNSE